MEAGVPFKILSWATLRVYTKLQIGLFCNFLSNCNEAAQFSAVPCDPASGFPQVARDFPKSFPIISQKGARTLLKKQSKVALCNESCSKVAQQNKILLFGLMLKDANCTTKVRFLSIFVQFWGVTSIAKQLWPQLKPKNAMSQYNCWMHFFIRDIQVPSSVNLRPPFWIFSKTHWPSSPAAFILRPWSAPGGRIWPLFYRKFINCLLKQCEIWKKGQFKH